MDAQDVECVLQLNMATLAKTSNITSHQETAIPNHEPLLGTQQNFLLSWRKWGGVWSNAPMLECSLVGGSSQLKGFTPCPSHSLLGMYLRKTTACMYTNFTAALLIVYQQMNEQMWYNHLMEYYSTMNSNEVLIHTTTWMNMKT